MTTTNDPRRPPSDELGWVSLKAIEAYAANHAINSPTAKLLCRTIRALCDERDRLYKTEIRARDCVEGLKTERDSLRAELEQCLSRQFQREL